MKPAEPVAQAARPASAPVAKKRPGNVVSRLFAPTASFLTSVTARRKESRAAREKAEAEAAAQKAKALNEVMASPQVRRACVHVRTRMLLPRSPASTALP